MSTITVEQRQAIADYLADRHIPSGLGSAEAACSIAAINLALYGKLTDDIPPCMSDVIGKAIIVIQDAMPSAIRNSARWKSLLPLAAGTGRAREPERLAIIMDWMWGTVLPYLQPLADQQGYGRQWREMLLTRTATAAWVVEAAAWAVEAAPGGPARAAAEAAAWAAAKAAAWAARAAAGAAAGATAWAVEEAAKAVEAAACAAAEEAAKAVEVAACAAAEAAAWETFNPCGLLERLIAVGDLPVRQ